ncbi:MAG: hypothetical protein U0469_01670 [Candidatus Paceibacterota bacterium]|jgi:hypothetical protein
MEIFKNKLQRSSDEKDSAGNTGKNNNLENHNKVKSTEEFEKKENDNEKLESMKISKEELTDVVLLNGQMIFSSLTDEWVVNGNYQGRGKFRKPQAFYEGEENFKERATVVYSFQNELFLVEFEAKLVEKVRTQGGVYHTFKSKPVNIKKLEKE